MDQFLPILGEQLTIERNTYTAYQEAASGHIEKRMS